MKSSKYRKSNGNTFYLVFLLCLLALIVWREKGNLDKETKSLSSKIPVKTFQSNKEYTQIDDHNKTVTNYLKDLDIRKYRKSAKMKIENYKNAPPIQKEKDEYSGINSNLDDRLDMEEPESIQIAKRVNKESVEDFFDPLESIDKSLQNEDIEKEQLQQERKAYIQEFQDNLRASGYKAVFDSNLRVKQIKKIRNK